MADHHDQSPDELAFEIFLLTLIGAVLYIGVAFLWVIL